MAACGTQREPRSVESAAEYIRRPDSTAVTMLHECNDDYAFVTRIQRDTAWVFLPGRTVALLEVPADSGARYELDDIVLRVEDEAAELELGASGVRECVNNRRSAIWEHAKLNGADFRAVGNEPGWHMQIHHDRIILVADYGTTTHEFETPEPAQDRITRRTTYTTSNDSHILAVLLEGVGCTDTMSGEEFETKVTVTLDERTLRGCGKALH